jgi:phosphoenolpyruvate carboxykinase (GTP)
MRVLEWMINRCSGQVQARETAIGSVPHISDININGLDAGISELEALLEVDTAAWSEEIEQIREYLQQYGDRLPERLLQELNKVTAQLARVA